MRGAWWMRPTWGAPAGAPQARLFAGLEADRSAGDAARMRVMNCAPVRSRGPVGDRGIGMRVELDVADLHVYAVAAHEDLDPPAGRRLVVSRRRLGWHRDAVGPELLRCERAGQHAGG